MIIGSAVFAESVLCSCIVNPAGKQGFFIKYI